MLAKPKVIGCMHRAVDERSSSHFPRDTSCLVSQESTLRCVVAPQLGQHHPSYSPCRQGSQGLQTWEWSLILAQKGAYRPWPQKKVCNIRKYSPSLLFYTQKSRLHHQDDTTLTQDRACFHKASLLQCMCCLIAFLLNQLDIEEYVITYFLFKLQQSWGKNMVFPFCLWQPTSLNDKLQYK